MYTWIECICENMLGGRETIFVRTDLLKGRTLLEYVNTKSEYYIVKIVETIQRNDLINPLGKLLMMYMQGR